MFPRLFADLVKAGLRREQFISSQRRRIYSASYNLSQIQLVSNYREEERSNSYRSFTPPSFTKPSVSFNPSIPKCVIFDKDGTLVCFHTMWSPWCTSLAERMSTCSGLDGISDNVYDVLGYDKETRKVRIGPLAENTHPQIKQKLETMLTQERGFHPDDAKVLVEKTWKDTPENMRIKMTGDLHHLFSRLKLNGVKIAICTSDSKEGTHEFLMKESLHYFIDMIVCGDDNNSKPKPDPHNAFHICNKLKVDLADTVMVGDTPADTLMGRHANLGLTVGVLSGVGDVKDLDDADVIVPSIDECIDMIIPEEERDLDESSYCHITNSGFEKMCLGSQFFARNQKKDRNIMRRTN